MNKQITPNSGFLSETETALTERFLNDGYIIHPVEDRPALERIRNLLVTLAANEQGMEAGGDEDAFLNGLHKKVTPGDLNDLRLQVFNNMNKEPWLRPAYFSLARQTLETLVGNELAMQRRVNLSIQLPDDDSSLLPLHADTLAGDSPFEVVQWLPLVDCHDTKSMFILPPEKNAVILPRLAEFHGQGLDSVTRAIGDDLAWLDVPFGSVLVFNQNLLHGNIVNMEQETRWTLNCRFKAVFTPYADKRLGEFFEPITLRAASRIGLDYEFPSGFGAKDKEDSN